MAQLVNQCTKCFFPTGGFACDSRKSVIEKHESGSGAEILFGCSCSFFCQNLIIHQINRQLESQMMQAYAVQVLVGTNYLVFDG